MIVKVWSQEIGETTVELVQIKKNFDNLVVQIIVSLL
jgi:hypothetical protein